MFIASSRNLDTGELKKFTNLENILVSEWDMDGELLTMWMLSYDILCINLQQFTSGLGGRGA